MTDPNRRGISRREFLKLAGVAGAALQVGGMAGAGLAAGADLDSYAGWQSFEGKDQTFDRVRFAINGPAYEKIGTTRRPSRLFDYVFGRAAAFREIILGAAGKPPVWKPADGVDALPEPFRTFYKENPETLKLDIERETVVFPKAKEDHAKYDDYFALANAWSEAWMSVRGKYPPPITSAPEVWDFEGVRKSALPFHSPTHAARLIKRVAHTFGATLVGITKLNPDWCYDVNVTGGKPGPFEKPAHWEYAIALGMPMEWDVTASNPAHGTSYDGYARSSIAAMMLTAFLKQLGYPARPHTPLGSYDLVLPPIMVDAGLGEQGRMGFVITPELGANFRSAVVTTNLPMVVDKPIKLGIGEFCNSCKICAETCPVGAISFADSNKGMNQRGYRAWKINNTQCYNFWESAMGPRGCRLCLSVCPFSRKSNWAHEMVRTIHENDPVGISREAVLWMQKAFFTGPKAHEYLPPPDGRFAGYRNAPEWLEVGNYLNIRVRNPQKGE